MAEDKKGEIKRADPEITRDITKNIETPRLEEQKRRHEAQLEELDRPIRDHPMKPLPEGTE